MTVQSELRPAERRSRIADLVRERGRVSVEDLAGEIDISRETIRRDLNALSARGLVRKFHGGAARISGDIEGSFRQRMGENVPAKLAIARRAASLFAPGEGLFIDTGSTTLYFAEALVQSAGPQSAGLTVITNSSAIARTLSPPGSPHRVVLIGGDYHHDNQETVGVMAVSQIRGFRTRHAILTIGAIAETGAVMDFSIEEAEVARAMAAQSEEVTILADLSKLARTALCEVCRLDEVRRLVCDRPPPTSVAQAIQAAGVELILA